MQNDSYNSNTPYDYLIKILLMGDTGVGKSSLLLRYADDFFTDSLIYTIGVDCKIKNIEIENKKTKLMIYDTTGQERFRMNFNQNRLRGVNVTIICFDITDRDSFTNMVSQTEGIDQFSYEDVTRVLVGTKSDLANSRTVTKEEAEAYAKAHSMLYIETSAKQNVNVNEVFEEASRLYLQQRSDIAKSLPGSVTTIDLRSELNVLMEKVKKKYPGVSVTIPKETANSSNSFEITLDINKHDKKAVQKYLQSLDQYEKIENFCDLKVRNSRQIWRSRFYLVVEPQLNLENQPIHNNHSNNNRNHNANKSSRVYSPNTTFSARNSQLLNNNNNNANLGSQNNSNSNKAETPVVVKSIVSHPHAVPNSAQELTLSSVQKEPVMSKNNSNLGFYSNPKNEMVSNDANSLINKEKLEKALCCTITGELMTDPVILTVDGRTYERKAITEWLEKNGTSPFNRVKVEKEDINKSLIPNYSMQSLIELYNKTHEPQNNQVKNI